MNAKVAREVLESFRCARQYPTCQGCDEEVDREDAYYRCKECDYDLCVACAREQLGLPSANHYDGQPPLQVGLGDILLVGGNDWDILHVIVVTGDLQQTHDLTEMVDVDLEPGQEVWKCETIESTRGARGTLVAADGCHDVRWYPSTTFLVRDPFQLKAWFVAQGAVSQGDANDDIEWSIEVGFKQPIKLLHHPLRVEYGNPTLTTEVFQQALVERADVSRAYGYATAVHAVCAYQHELSIDSYPTKHSRLRLLDQVESSWRCKPICAAVPVQVWQRYFVLLNKDDRDAAAKHILQHMPVMCNKVTPSALVKSLTSRGWVLSDSLEV